MRKLFLISLLCLLIPSVKIFGQPIIGVSLPDPVSHPRLFMTEGEEGMIKEALGKEEVLQKVDSVIVSFCDSVMAMPTLRRTMVGKRLLHTSREAIKRIFYLSYGYRVHGNEAYARRAIEEMRAVCSFSDWNPYHFLDVGEMALAVGIGYDWLYGLLSEKDKEMFSSAMTEKAFTPAKDEEKAWFYDSEINWNQVCNGGLAAGALAVFDELPFESARVIQRAVETIHLPLDGGYSPEGCYAEGYNYWGYGTSFQIILAAALESAFGTDCGILDGKEGFRNSSRFMMMMNTPRHGIFNFGDCSQGASAQYMQAWMALKYGNVAPLRPEMEIMKDSGYSSFAEERLLPFFMVCASRLSSEGTSLENIPSPMDRFYECGGTTPLFIYRSGWDGPDDTYFAIKGGKASSSHSHCDQGTFIFESDGVGWAVDLGMQDYNSLESRGLDIWNTKQPSDRWKVYRIGPFSHNILTIDGKVPEVDSYVGIERIWKDPSCKGAELPLTLFYMNDLDTFFRKATLDGNNDLFIRDSLVNGNKESLFKWQMCTEAAPYVQSDGSILLQSGAHTRILSVTTLPGYGPQVKLDATPFIEDAGPVMDYDEPNPGKSIVGFTFSLPPEGRINLLFSIRKTE